VCCLAVAPLVWAMDGYKHNLEKRVCLLSLSSSVVYACSNARRTQIAIRCLPVLGRWFIVEFWRWRILLIDCGEKHWVVNVPADSWHGANRSRNFFSFWRGKITSTIGHVRLLPLSVICSGSSDRPCPCRTTMQESDSRVASKPMVESSWWGSQQFFRLHIFDSRHSIF